MKPSEVQFLHLRYFDEKGLVMGKGGMTLAYTIKDDNTGLFTIDIGKAICCEKDNFCRKYGRLLSVQRLNSLPYHKSTYMGFDLNGTITTKHTEMEQIHNTIENWAYNGALN